MGVGAVSAGPISVAPSAVIVINRDIADAPAEPNNNYTFIESIVYLSKRPFNAFPVIKFIICRIQNAPNIMTSPTAAYVST